MVSGKVAVLGDRPVAREIAGSCDGKHGLASLSVMIRIKFAQPLIGVQRESAINGLRVAIQIRCNDIL
jgi:hypothetical protein